MGDNHKFLEDEFKRILSSCGFRGTVSRWDDTYRVELEKDATIAYPQLAMLSEKLGTRKINIRNVEGFAGTENTGGYPDEWYLEVTW
jgi:hypothetical protein